MQRAARRQRFVDDFYRRVLSDSALAPAFVGVDREQLRRHLEPFWPRPSAALASYSGRNMTEAHRGRGITKAQFAGVAAHLHEALRGIVPEGKIEQILVTIAALQPLIVER